MITYYYTSFLMPHLWNLHVTCCHSWLLLQKLSHLSSFGHDGCTSLQGSSWSQPKFHSPEWQRWWENGRRQNAFCTGSPAVRSEGNELSRKGKQWAVLPTMTSFMTTQTHKRITTTKSTNPTIGSLKHESIGTVSDCWQWIKLFSPKWLPWSCSGHGCRWCGLWPVPSCCPTIYLHEAEEDSTTVHITFKIYKKETKFKKNYYVKSSPSIQRNGSFRCFILYS